jgi:hypothetical protein
MTGLMAGLEEPKLETRMRVFSVCAAALVMLSVAGCGNGSGQKADGPPPRSGGNGQSGDDQSVADAPAGTVVLRGGYETDPVDRGRPVALIAAALGVETEVFRQAFSGVTPAHGRGPSEAEARANKKVLLDALGKYGITNERLDEVSNYYRYQPQSGELWQHTPATATVTISDGQIIELKITNPGAGYMTPPSVLVAGHEAVKVEATIEFTNDFATNGRVASLTLVK